LSRQRGKLHYSQSCIVLAAPIQPNGIRRCEIERVLILGSPIGIKYLPHSNNLCDEDPATLIGKLLIVEGIVSTGLRGKVVGSVKIGTRYVISLCIREM